MTVLITGGTGQLGLELSRQLGPQACALDRVGLDITDRQQVWEVVQKLRPSAVVNCAAYIKVDLAEEQAEHCERVNALAVEHLADACRQANSVLVQVSTDYVFGGDVHRSLPYRETDPPNPQSVYACTKLRGEQFAGNCPRHFVVRTCGLYGMTPERRNFVETMLRLGKERKSVRVVGDQHCTPTHVAEVARTILFLLSTEAYGIYHVVNAGATTWSEFAREIFRLAKVVTTVDEISTEEFGAVAPRPRYSVLSTSKLESLRGDSLPNWQTALQSYLASRGFARPRSRG